MNYASSKAGVQGLTRTAAKELSKFGIRCNCVLPGFITTPMTDKVPEKVIDKITSIIPLGRMGEPAEVADACAFLASDDSRYITGVSIEVAGKKLDLFINHYFSRNMCVISCRNELLSVCLVLIYTVLFNPYRRTLHWLKTDC